MAATRSRVLMYHGLGASHQDGRRSRSYDVTLDALGAHYHALHEVLPTAPTLFDGSLRAQDNARVWAITFDDGLASVAPAADLLESLGWRGHFFVVTSWIGTPRYLTSEAIVDLHRRGHVIGSHSVTHPDPMNRLTPDRLLEEWRRSADDLSSLLGAAVRVAAVPGGAYSPRVAAAAAQAGLEVLFTSEPVSLHVRVDGCEVLGRYTVRAGTDPGRVVRLVTGDRTACGAQWTGWNTRKLAKMAAGGAYAPVRARLLRTPVAPDEQP